MMYLDGRVCEIQIFASRERTSVDREVVGICGWECWNQNNQKDTAHSVWFADALATLRITSWRLGKGMRLFSVNKSIRT